MTSLSFIVDRNNILPYILGFIGVVGCILFFLAGIKIFRKKENERTYDQPGVTEPRPEYIELDSFNMYDEVDGYKMDQQITDHTEKPFSGKNYRMSMELAG